MKTRSVYYLYINRMLGTAWYGGINFYTRIQNATLGELYDCSFSQLKHNLHLLQKQGFRTFKSKS